METFYMLLAICVGEFPAQRPVTRSFDFSLMCARINGWVNNGEVGNLRRHHAHYDVIVTTKIMHVSALDPSYDMAICNQT